MGREAIWELRRQVTRAMFKRTLSLLLLLPILAVTKMMMPESVPVDRLIQNVTATLKDKPNDVEQKFLLARLHSLAYAQKDQNSSVYFDDRSKKEGPFHLAPWTPLQPKRDQAGDTLTDHELGHLKSSFTLYGEVVKSNPEMELPKLGLAWVSEEAAKYPKRTSNFAKDKKLTADLFRAIAAHYYRELVAGAKPFNPDELKWGYDGENPGYEAANNLLRMFKAEQAKPEKGEPAKLEALVQAYTKVPRVVSPIVFSLSGKGPLLDSTRTTTFDVAADGIRREWPWVAPDTAFLAWDPKGTGVIRDGTQLFGNRTFNMFFRNGYAALASLDNNRDGWLTGAEMKGIVVWHDKNSDGRSNRQELTPVERLGISAIRTKSSGVASGMLSATDGLRYLSGQTAPTYDWLPTSKAAVQRD